MFRFRRMHTSSGISPFYHQGLSFTCWITRMRWTWFQGFNDVIVKTCVCVYLATHTQITRIIHCTALLRQHVTDAARLRQIYRVVTSLPFRATNTVGKFVKFCQDFVCQIGPRVFPCEDFTKNYLAWRWWMPEILNKGRKGYVTIQWFFLVPHTRNE